MLFPTSANQVKAFSVAMYGKQVGTTTMVQVNNDIIAFGGLTAAMNAYYTTSFGSHTTASVAATVAANLGLTGDVLTAGTNYLIGVLNAAAPGERGKVVLDALNLLSSLSSNAIYGDAATAWNAKVALAAAYTGSENVDIGTVVTMTNDPFTLTTGADNFTGGAGDNTFNATGLTLNSLDVITGGADADTLNVVASGSLTALRGTITGVETINVTATSATGDASLGTLASTATIDARQSQTYDWAGTGVVIGGSVVLNIGGVLTTLATTADTSTMATNTAAAINNTLNAAYGTTGTTYASASSAVVTYNSPTAGKALPPISFSKGTSNTTLVAPSATVVQANQVAAAAVSASTFTAPTGTTAFNVETDANAFLGAKATTDTTVSAGGVVKLATTKNADITAGDSVAVTGAKGAVKIVTAPTATSIASQFAAASGSTATSAAGVSVQGGTTVDITVSQSSTTGINTGKIQVGAATSEISGATASTYPKAIGNLALNPTGDVTITGVTTAKSSTTGLTTSTYNNGAVEVTTNGATTVTVKGIGATSTVTDAQTQTTTASAGATAAAGTSTLTTVNLAGLAAGVTIKSDVISKVSIADTLTAQTVTVSGSSSTSSNKGALNVELSNAGKASNVVTVAAANVTSVTVSSGAAAADKVSTGGAAAADSNASSASTVTLNTPKATSIAFTNTLPVTLDSQSTTNFAKVASITASGSGNVTLGDVSTLHAAAQALTTIDASAASGKLSVTIGATDDTHGLTVKGGSGNDTVTVKGTIGNVTTATGTVVTTTVDLGAGNDKFLYAATGVIAAGAGVDGGAGNDTISYNFLNAGISGLVKNFEVIDIAGSGAASYDMSLYSASAFSGVAVSGAATSDVTVSKLAGTNVGVDVTSSAATTAIATVTATLATSTGTADTATINFAPTLLAANATATMAGFKSTGIETINVSSTQTQSTASGTNVGKGVIELVTDTSNTTASIVVTGEGSFTLGKYNTASTTYSAGSTGFLSGVAQYTTAPTTVITDATTAAALKTIDASAATGVQVIVAGSAQADVHGASTTDLVYTGLTIKGGSAADTLVNAADSGVVNGGAGADTIIVTGKASVVDGGSGADTIYVFGGVAATLTGGTGNNTYQLTGASVGSLTSVKMVTITDYKTSDTLVIGDADPFAIANISSATGFQNMLELAAASGDAGNASYFVYAGDTYIVRDVNADDALDTGDLIVKLVGVTSLTGLTGDATTGLVGVA
jgi:hypothetical protein